MVKASDVPPASAIAFYDRTIRWTVTSSLISYLLAVIAFDYSEFSGRSNGSSISSLETFSIGFAAVAIVGLLVKLVPRKFSIDKYAYLAAGAAGTFTTISFWFATVPPVTWQTFLFSAFLVSGILAAYSAYIGESHNWGLRKFAKCIDNEL